MRPAERETPLTRDDDRSDINPQSSLRGRVGEKTGTKRHKRHRPDPTAEFWSILERRHGLTREEPRTMPLPGLSQLTAADGTPEPELPTTAPED